MHLILISFSSFLDLYGISKSGAHGVFKKYQDRSPMKISNEISQDIMEHFKNIEIHPSSVRRILLKNGMSSYSARKKPYLTNRMKIRRL